MAHIDRFIEVIFKFEADKLVLDTDQRAGLVSGESVRHVTGQPTSHKQIQDLVQEILPEDTTRILTTESGREFEYAAPSGLVRVRVQRHAHGTRVEVEPATQRDPLPPAAAGEGRVGIAVSMDPSHGHVTAVAASPGIGPETVFAVPTTAGAPALAGGLHIGSGVLPTVAESHPVTAATPAIPAVGFAAARNPLTSPARTRPRIDALFEKMVQHRCSDLHICVGSPPFFRKDGEITMLGETTVLTAEQIRDLLLEITPAPNCTEYEARHDTDFSYEMNEQARFRANLFMDRRGMGAVFRLVPGKIPTPQELGLSKQVLELCQLPKGLVLITGPTGSGKSTTLAALIDYINGTRPAHIITIEDPIEFVHTNKKCLVNQREVGVHTEGFKTALRAALREDPDILLVGEMRDLETVAIAIETAETGHLVFGTLHTNTAASAIDRMIDQFSADRQAQVRTMLSESLKGVIAQTLLRRRTGGLVAAQEVLLVTPAISNLIREGKTFQIQSIMQTGRSLGMLTMNDALLELVRSGLVEMDTALNKAPNRAEFKAAVERAGARTPAGRETVST
jgi:twitching motility protein PilT